MSQFDKYPFLSPATGKGGIFTSPSPSAGSGGDVGSGNSNFGLQDFSDSTLSKFNVVELMCTVLNDAILKTLFIIIRNR